MLYCRQQQNIVTTRYGVTNVQRARQNDNNKTAGLDANNIFNRSRRRARFCVVDTPHHRPRDRNRRSSRLVSLTRRDGGGARRCTTRHTTSPATGTASIPPSHKLLRRSIRYNIIIVGVFVVVVPTAACQCSYFPSVNITADEFPKHMSARTMK